MNILLLDDEEKLLSSVSRMLVLMGHNVETYTSAKQAAEAIATEKYDFALVDYLMPENDGIWFMKHAEVPKKTKVLLMTAYVNRKVISEMFRLGAVGYLIKPFDADEVNMHFHYHTHKSA